MSKWQLSRPDGPWEYPTLGFRAVNGDILDATAAPDGFWSLAGNQGAAETVKRIPGAASGASGYVRPGTSSYTYNADGSVATETNGNAVTAYTYNADGSVATATTNGVTLTYYYDANGNVTAVA